MWKTVLGFFKNWKLGLANNAAYWAISPGPFLTSLLIELWFLHYSFWQWGFARLPYGILKITFAPECCAYLDRYLRKIFRANNKNKLQKFLADGLSMPIIQQLSFVLGAIFMGRKPAQTFWLSTFYFVEGFLWSALAYGKVLDYFRLKIAGLKNGNGNGIGHK